MTSSTIVNWNWRHRGKYGVERTRRQQSNWTSCLTTVPFYAPTQTQLCLREWRGDDLTVMFRNSVVVRRHSLQSAVTLTSFEFQLVRVDYKHSFSVLVNVYRTPSSSLATFYLELSNLISVIWWGTTDRIVLCDDLNCPRVKVSHSGKELEIVLNTFSLTQHINSPKHAVTRCSTSSLAKMPRRCGHSPGWGRINLLLLGGMASVSG